MSEQAELFRVGEQCETRQVIKRFDTKAETDI